MFYLPLFIVLFLSFLLEVLTTLPLIFISMISYSALQHSKNAPLYALIAGVISAIVTSRSISLSIVYFLIISFIVKLYGRRFNQESLSFMFIFSFISGIIYLLIFRNQLNILIAILSSISSILILFLFYLVNLSKNQEQANL